jgi:hypothetical protein
VAYSKKCSSCSTLRTFGYLREHHQIAKHSLPELLLRLQSKKSRRSALSDLQKIASALSTLTAKTTAAARAN